MMSTKLSLLDSVLDLVYLRMIDEIGYKMQKKDLLEYTGIQHTFFVPNVYRSLSFILGLK